MVKVSNPLTLIILISTFKFTKQNKKSHLNPKQKPTDKYKGQAKMQS